MQRTQTSVRSFALIGSSMFPNVVGLAESIACASLM